MPRTTRRWRPPRLGQADLALLAFASEHHAILAAQAAALLGVAESTARGRLARLRRAGLMDDCATLQPLPRLHRITARGLRAIPSALPAPRRQTLCARHDLALGWLWLAARAGAFGPLGELHSERAIRANEGRAASSATEHGGSAALRGSAAALPGSAAPRPGSAAALATREVAVAAPDVGECAPAARPVGPKPPGVGGRSLAFAHTPDLVALSAGGRRIAFELELSPKPDRRLEQIIAAYAGDRRYDLVVYLTDDPGVARRVRAAAQRLGCEEVLRVGRVRLPAMIASRSAGATCERRLATAWPARARAEAAR